MKRVVVIGGGFSGLMALKQLIKSRNLKLILINKSKYFLFTPRLTELLNESISEKLVKKDINSIFGNRIDFINEMGNFIDFNKKYVKAGKNNIKINYDYLIMSQGATTNYFGNKNIEKNSIGYKDHNAVLKIKNNIKNILDKASNNKKKRIITFAVIGGGLTGVELTCSLREFTLKEIKKYSNLDPNNVKFIIIQSSEIILPQLSDSIRSKIEKYLINNGIEIITNTRAEDIKNNTIICKNRKIKVDITIWTAGIKANAIKTNPKLNLDRGNTIKVDSKLKIPMNKDVYVCGDAALIFDKGKFVAATAQSAIQEGTNIGKNILRRINGKKEKNFNYIHQGTLIVLGRKQGICTINNITLNGRLAWYIRHLAYVYRFWQIT